MINFYRVSLIALALPSLWAQPNVSLKPIDESLSQITVIGPNDPTFQTVAFGLIPTGDIPAYAPIVPYCVIVKNDTPRNLLAIGVDFQIVDAQGRSSHVLQNFANFPSVRRPLLTPGKMLLIAPESSYTLIAAKARTHFGLMHPLEYYASSKSISISLQYVLFRNGTFVGPDTADTYDVFAAELAAMQTVGRTAAAYKSQGAFALKQYLDQTAAGINTAFNSLSRGFQPNFNLDIAKFAQVLDRQFNQKGVDAVFSTASSWVADTGNVVIHK